jgi:hypothetical protein
MPSSNWGYSKMYYEPVNGSLGTGVVQLLVITLSTTVAQSALVLLLA